MRQCSFCMSIPMSMPITILFSISTTVLIISCRGFTPFLYDVNTRSSTNEVLIVGNEDNTFPILKGF